MTEILNSTKIIQLSLDLRPLRARMDGRRLLVRPTQTGTRRVSPGTSPSTSAQPPSPCPNPPRMLRPWLRSPASRGFALRPRAPATTPERSADLEDTILLKTHRMRGVTINPDTQRRPRRGGRDLDRGRRSGGRVRPGALAGSSPDVGVVGYTLGGGLSWLARKHGIGANQVTAIEVVTASGDFVRTDWANEPDLFWALRGGGGSFGIVTAIEFNLFPIDEVYAGILWYPVERAAEVLKAWRDWTEDLPDEMTSVGRILQFPPIPEIPEPVRGQSFVVVEAIWSGEPAEGERLLEPLRALGPVMDTVTTIPDRGAEPAAHGSRRAGSRHRRRRHARRRRRPSDRPLRRARRRHADPLGRDPSPRRRGRAALVAARGDRRLGGAVHHVRGRDRADARGRARPSTARSRDCGRCSSPGRPSTRT